MSFLIDSDVAIHLRDADEEVGNQVSALAGPISLSLATLIELQAGLAKAGPLREWRSAGLSRITQRFPIVALSEEIVHRYGTILLAAGFSRAKVFDRLIAATALVHDLTLVTINGPDFRDIPGLKLEVWPAPAQ